jgi:hypothetical protein
VPTSVYVKVVRVCWMQESRIREYSLVHPVRQNENFGTDSSNNGGSVKYTSEAAQADRNTNKEQQ